MDWIMILGLVLFGIALVVVEVIFVPGTTVVGVLGFLFGAFGVYLAYDRFGSSPGTYVLLGSILMTVGATVWSFRNKSWERFSLHQKHEGRAHEELQGILEVGQRGQARSDLKPVGMAEFGQKIVEVKTLGNHVSSGQQVEIIQIKDNRIIVQPLT